MARPRRLPAVLFTLMAVLAVSSCRNGGSGAAQDACAPGPQPDPGSTPTLPFDEVETDPFQRIDVDGRPITVVEFAGDAWVAVEGTHVVRVDPDGNVVDRIDVGGRPGTLVSTGDRLWIVTDRVEGGSRGASILALDESGSTVVGPHPVDEGAVTLAVHEGIVYVGNIITDQVQRIVADTGRETEPIGVPSGVVRIAVAGGVMWVTSRDEPVVRRFDVADGSPIGAPVQVGDLPIDVVVAGGVAWVAAADSNWVCRVDAATGVPLGEPVPVGDGPVEMALSGGIMWVANQDSASITRIDATSGEVRGDEIRVLAQPRDIAVGRGTIFLTTFNPDLLLRLDTGDDDQE